MLGQVSKILKCACHNPYIENQIVRHGHRMRGKRPGEAKSLSQLLEKLNYVDPELSKKIDIGFAEPQKSRKDVGQQAEYLQAKKKDKNFEKAARSLKLNISLDEVKQEWLRTEAPRHIRQAAEHYGVFKDLFGHAFFTPLVNLDISYKLDDGKLAPVHRGNVVKPREALTAPLVEFSSSLNDLWTLTLSNPDGHLTDNGKEYVHWMIGNIPGSDISKGDLIYDYLQPFPPQGIGFQRFCFVLYKQEKKLDFSDLKKNIPCRELKERTFETKEFYRSRQDDLTPAGLAFFQTDWDSSVRETFHKVLNMDVPKFEYDFVQPYVAPPKWFARRKAFNMYLDKYRDPRDIAKDFLIKKLSTLDPFEPPKKPFPYPNVHKFDRRKTPSWWITEERRVRLGLGRINLQKDDDQ